MGGDQGMWEGGSMNFELGSWQVNGSKVTAKTPQ